MHTPDWACHHHGASQFPVGITSHALCGTDHASIGSSLKREAHVATKCDSCATPAKISMCAEHADHMIVVLVFQEMDPKHSDNMTSMNLNMYPSTEGKTFPEGAQRIWSHTDYEALTLLFQKPGLPYPLLCSKDCMPRCCLMTLVACT